MMKRIMRLVALVGACIVVLRGVVSITDDICKFINRRKEAKKNADDSVDECIGPTVTAP